MNLEQIKEIIRLFEASSLSFLDVKSEGERVRLRRGEGGKATVQTTHREDSQVTVTSGKTSAGPDFNRVIKVKSPAVGIFYEAPEPGGKPFVRVGDQVTKGDVLCLIEVMKQVTEVTAPQDGQVADICPTNGSVVEFGQTLMKLC